MILTHDDLEVYPRIAGLIFLLAYARKHRHSAWIAPLTRLLEKGGAAHG